jgi:hypothetical protein
VKPKFVARRVSDLAVVADLIEEAIEANSNATTPGIVDIVTRDLGERGYAERVLAWVTEEYVEDVWRAMKRRPHARKPSRKSKQRKNKRS